MNQDPWREKTSGPEPTCSFAKHEPHGVASTTAVHDPGANREAAGHVTAGTPRREALGVSRRRRSSAPRGGRVFDGREVSFDTALAARMTAEGYSRPNVKCNVRGRLHVRSEHADNGSWFAFGERIHIASG